MTEPTSDPGRTDAADPAGASHGETGAGGDHYTDRYGRAPRPKRWRRLGALLTGVVVLAGTGIAYVGWTKFGPKDIESEQLGYSVLDDSSVELRIRLTRSDPSVPVVCVVRAMSRDLTEIGRREVVIAPSGAEQTVQVSTVIEASEKPASAAIYTCTDSVPGYLKTE
ncbi:DUF4307 domain-containing protein [Nocardia speluncae]|uniref:DUF4307 domain-containing protein n=1 Tax=Nocardia speluncae TaxID=419477 RepID=A0A846XE99_9NOCA|nr:DUF4307 domain-containing protein [Nocardia speluncae]NKY34272.1 DUF4307 domain-containing protein [Nocardia speluncae]